MVDLLEDLAEDDVVVLDESSLGIDTTKSAADISKQTIVLELHVSQPGFRKKVDVAKVFSDNVELTCDHKLLHISKDLVDKKELRGIRKAQNEFISWIREQKIPSKLFGNGMYLMPLSQVQEIDARIGQFITKRSECLNEFKLRYPAIIEEMRERLGSEFLETEYPSIETLLSMYDVSYNWLTFDVPAALSSISKDIYRKASEKLQIEFEDTWKDCREALRTNFAELCGHFAEVLGTDATTGKKKVFRGSNLTKLQEFCRAFETRDLTSDDELARLAKQSRELLSGVDRKQIISEEGLRDSLQRSFLEIKQAADSMITLGGERVFLTDEEEN